MLGGRRRSRAALCLSAYPPSPPTRLPTLTGPHAQSRVWNFSRAASLRSSSVSGTSGMARLALACSAWSLSSSSCMAFFFSCVGVEVGGEGQRSATQLCPSLCDPINCSPPGRQGYWSELTFPPPGKLPSPGIELWFPVYPALAGRFFTTELSRAAMGRDGGCQSHASSMPSELGAGMGIPSSSPPISSSLSLCEERASCSAWDTELVQQTGDMTVITVRATGSFTHFSFLAATQSRQDFSSLTRGQTLASCSGSMES